MLIINDCLEAWCLADDPDVYGNVRMCVLSESKVQHLAASLLVLQAAHQVDSLAQRSNEAIGV